MPKIICDLCSSQPIVRRFHCPDHVSLSAPAAIQASLGDWAACETCARMIDQGDRDALLERSVDMFFQRCPKLHRTGANAALLRLEIFIIHSRFFKHWEGSSEPTGNNE